MRQAYESSDTSLDLKELLVRVEYDRELLDDVFQIFKEEFPKLQILLKDAIAQGDIKQVQASAHTLKGMLGSMSFSHGSALAFQIERMAKLADHAGLQAEVLRLEIDTAASIASLEEFCSGIAQ